MMVNSKDKGSRFEREIVDVLNTKFKGQFWKRIPMSGAIGTIVNESNLTGDIVGKIPGFPRRIKGECKVGYAKSAKSMTIKKEWLDKLVEEASHDRSFPVLFGKFENTHSGVKYFAVLPIENFVELLSMLMEEEP